MLEQTSTSDKIKCCICKQLLVLCKMREHVGAHILAGHVPAKEHPCGFCGGTGCSAKLVKKAGHTLVPEA
jgi:hypothetical protein